MARYIDADERDAHIDEMMNAVSKHKYGNMNEWDCLNWMRDIIDEAPTVDAVEVVRCKDCKHSDAYPDKELIWCLLHGCMMADNGYCDCGDKE